VYQQQSCKPGSVPADKPPVSIINLGQPLPAGSINLPILTNRNPFEKLSGDEPPRFQDLFGFSTPEVYRDPGRPEKP